MALCLVLSRTERLFLWKAAQACYSMQEHRSYGVFGWYAVLSDVLFYVGHGSKRVPYIADHVYIFKRILHRLRLFILCLNVIALQPNKTESTYIFVLLCFAALGLFDKMFHNKLGLASSFDKGIITMGDFMLSVGGFYCIAIAFLNNHSGLFQNKEMIITSLLAPDLGGYSIVETNMQSNGILIFCGVLLASTLGCLISFQLPIFLNELDKNKIRINPGIITFDPILNIDEVKKNVDLFKRIDYYDAFIFTRRLVLYPNASQKIKALFENKNYFMDNKVKILYDSMVKYRDEVFPLYIQLNKNIVNETNVKVIQDYHFKCFDEIYQILKDGEDIDLTLENNIVRTKKYLNNLLNVK